MAAMYTAEEQRQRALAAGHTDNWRTTSTGQRYNVMDPPKGNQTTYQAPAAAPAAPPPVAPPAPIAPAASAVPGASANAGIATVASDPTSAEGAGVVAPSVQALMDRADMGGVSGDMGGQMRMLGQRMPSAESLALAGLGRKVY